MNALEQNEPLTNAEIGRLRDFLKGCKDGRAMNVEELERFFAALIAGPGTLMPSEYYPEVFGVEMSDACEFGSIEEANEILGLMMRHWSDIAGNADDRVACRIITHNSAQELESLLACDAGGSIVNAKVQNPYRTG